MHVVLFCCKNSFYCLGRAIGVLVGLAAGVCRASASRVCCGGSPARAWLGLKGWRWRKAAQGVGGEEEGGEQGRDTADGGDVEPPDGPPCELSAVRDGTAEWK